MRIGTIVAIIVGLIILGIVIVKFNNIAKYDEAVSRFWTPLDSSLDLRYAAVPQLTRIVDAYTGRRDETMQQLMKTQQAFESANTVRDKAAAADQLESLLDRVWVQCGSLYPGIDSSYQFANIKQTFAISQSNMINNLTAYNNAVALYNGYIREFPQDVISLILGFKHGAYVKQAGPGVGP